MTEAEYIAKLARLDRILNDPMVPLDPIEVWRLQSELAGYDDAHGLEDERGVIEQSANTPSHQTL